MNLRQLTYGILSFLPGLANSLSKGTGGTTSARYCYCIWLRHVVLTRMHGASPDLRVIGELGPGDSIGVGLAALISGSERYIALDAVEHADLARNLAIFDELVTLFRNRADIPGPREFPDIALDLPDLSFPAEIFDDTRLTRALEPNRIERIRAAVARPGSDPCLVYRAPWGRLEPADRGSIDFLLSNAVMEHVSDLPDAYRAIEAWLRSGGIASHQIDFRSHGLFAKWDGHWACPDWLWRLFIGRRPYLLNREPFQTHRALGRESGLQEAAFVRVECAPQASHIAARFASMPQEDRTTCGAYFLQRKA